jgi:hypothetical protein
MAVKGSIYADTGSISEFPYLIYVRFAIIFLVLAIVIGNSNTSIYLSVRVLARQEINISESRL